MIGYITKYGNGYNKIYIPKNDKNSSYIPVTKEEREKENRRLRGVKSRQNYLQRALSTDSYNYFTVLTTDDEELVNNPKLLGVLANRFIREEIELNNYIDNNYILNLECFYKESRGFHIHCLSDFPVNLERWYRLYGADKTIDSKELTDELDERWILEDNPLNNLYCQKLKYLDDNDKERDEAVSIAAHYNAKKIKETKKRIEKIYPNQQVSVYYSNVKKVDRESEEIYIDERLSLENNIKLHKLKKEIFHYENEIKRNNEYIDVLQSVNKNAYITSYLDYIKNCEREIDRLINEINFTIKTNVLNKINAYFYNSDYKNYYAINFKIKKNQIDFNNIDKGFLDDKILKNISYVDFQSYKIEKIKEIEEEIIFFNFRIKEIENVINEILKIDKTFDISYYLEAIVNFKNEICKLQRRITFLTEVNSPNSDNLYYSYNCNGFIDKIASYHSYHGDYRGAKCPILCPVSWLCGWANRPVNKKSVLSRKKKN